MKDIQLRDGFVPQGAPHPVLPVRAVTLGAGVIWEEAYDAVTTKAGAYVQGGGCTTVGVAGLIQGGGFGSFSKYFGLAASGLLEAEVVTADGSIRTVNAYKDPELFWALKGGGGGTFAVVSRLTLRVHDLPKDCGGAMLIVKANSDGDFQLLIAEFLKFYKTALFNPHWGESANFGGDNTLDISMMHIGLSDDVVMKTWQPFLEWLQQNGSAFSVHTIPLNSSFTTANRAAKWLVKKTGKVSIESDPVISSSPTRFAWDEKWDGENRHWFTKDPRPGSNPVNVWYKADTGQVEFFLWEYDSVWLPAGLLDSNSQSKLVEALFDATRHTGVSLHFNKGLAGATSSVIEEARNTPMNPAVCDAFALAISAAAEDAVFPAVHGHTAKTEAGRKAARSVQDGMNVLRSVAPRGGAYISESSYFDADYQRSAWGENYKRLARVKRTYDPDGLFFVHHGVGSEGWSADGFTRRI